MKAPEGIIMRSKYVIILFFIAICGFAQDGLKDLDFLIEDFDPELVLRFSIEGNFCNSGEREIIGFYQVKSTLVIEDKPYNVLQQVYCFIINEQTGSVLQAYEIPLEVISEFSEDNNLTSMPGDALGNSVEWLGYTIGYAGDFNRNGRDELSFYSLSGMGFIPWFCEFSPDANEFKQILEYPNPVGHVTILGIDPEQKKFLFREYIGQNPSRDIAFQWDGNAQMYVESAWSEPVGAEQQQERAFGIPFFLVIASGIATAAVIGVLIAIKRKKRY